MSPQNGQTRFQSRSPGALWTGPAPLRADRLVAEQEFGLGGLGGFGEGEGGEGGDGALGTGSVGSGGCDL